MRPVNLARVASLPSRRVAAIAALAIFAAPATAAAHDGAQQQSAADDAGALLGPAGDAVRSILGLGGFFDDLNVIPGTDAPVTGGPERLGSFGEPFVEPELEGVTTPAKCVTDPQGYKHCKPAAGTMNVLPDGRVMYWDALE